MVFCLGISFLLIVVTTNLVLDFFFLFFFFFSDLLTHFHSPLLGVKVQIQNLTENNLHASSTVSSSSTGVSMIADLGL